MSLCGLSFTGTCGSVSDSVINHIVKLRETGKVTHQPGVAHYSSAAVIDNYTAVQNSSAKTIENNSAYQPPASVLLRPALYRHKDICTLLHTLQFTFMFPCNRVTAAYVYVKVIWEKNILTLLLLLCAYVALPNLICKNRNNKMLRNPQFDLIVDPWFTPGHVFTPKPADFCNIQHIKTGTPLN